MRTVVEGSPSSWEISSGVYPAASRKNTDCVGSGIASILSNTSARHVAVQGVVNRRTDVPSFACENIRDAFRRAMVDNQLK